MGLFRRRKVERPAGETVDQRVISVLPAPKFGKTVLSMESTYWRSAFASSWALMKTRYQALRRANHAGRRSGFVHPSNPARISESSAWTSIASGLCLIAFSLVMARDFGMTMLYLGVAGLVPMAIGIAVLRVPGGTGHRRNRARKPR